MMHEKFVEDILPHIVNYRGILGLAVGGSWINQEMDSYSDLDLIVVTEQLVSSDRLEMINFASSIGKLLNAFTGEHVGEPRVLICLYSEPLLHVDIKFVTLEEFYSRVENPQIIWEKEQQLSKIIASTVAKWPDLDLQWIEDRFWTWIHYAALKLGRGEYFEVLDMLSFIRAQVLGPLLQVKSGHLPRGVRRVERNLPASEIEDLKETIAIYSLDSIIAALKTSIEIYQKLRKAIYGDDVFINLITETKCLEYLEQVIMSKRPDL